MLRSVTLFLLASFAGGFLVHADTQLNLPGYHMLWNDEFEGTSLDTSKWEVNRHANAWYIRASDGMAIQPALFSDEPFIPWTQFGRINDERQYYYTNNVSVQNGMLVLESREEGVTNPVGDYDPNYHKYTSGKVNTADEFRFQFGVVKISAQVPGGKGMWPALWMMDYPVP